MLKWNKIFLFIIITFNLHYKDSNSQSLYPVGNGLYDQWGYCYIKTMTTFNNEIIAGGNFIKNGDGDTIRGIARLDGNIWKPLGSGIIGNVVCMKEFKGELYVGGSFKLYGTNEFRHIIKWNGTVWNSAGESCCNVKCFETYHDTLFMGIGSSIIKWDGMKWNTVGSFNTTSGIPASEITNMTVFDDELIVNGTFRFHGSANVDTFFHIARWNGYRWASLPYKVTPPGYDEGLNNLGGMIEFNGELFVGGANLGVNYYNSSLYIWNKTTGWDFDRFGDTINGMEEYNTKNFEILNNKLYATGGFKWDSLTWSSFASYDGKQWSCLDTSTIIFSLFKYNNELYTNSGVNCFSRIDFTTNIQPEIKNEGFYIKHYQLNNKLYFSSSNTQSLFRVDIFDGSGKKVFTKDGIRLPSSLSSSAFKSGIYFYRFQEEKKPENLVTGKIIIFDK